MTTPTTASDNATLVVNDIIGWYWTHGSCRQDEYAVSSTWLRRVYEHREVLHSIASGSAQTKACLGLWGPSQSGKSTLISQFVDQGASVDGKGGLLDWGTPALFSGRDGVPESVAVFNPHNIGADASGCVSRFVLEEGQPRHLNFPVEISLLNHLQIMHAISAGYASECQHSNVWTCENIDDLLGKLKSDATAVPINRGAFEHLCNVLQVVDRLVEARDPRFASLNLRGQWPSLANRIIEADALLSSEHAAKEFGATLLWDNDPCLNRLYERLLAARDRLPRGRMYCTMEVAAVLVNIDAFRIFLSHASDSDLLHGARRIRTIIRHLSFDTQRDDVLIGTCFPERRLLNDDTDFGLLQGLVRELVIPLRSPDPDHSPDSMQQHFIRAMKNTEIIDFPGIPWREKNVTEALLNLADAQSSDDPRLLTEVLKRGKVRSLINDYSHTLGIDAFVLFTRAGMYVPKVEQLHRSIVSWWRNVDPAFDVYKSVASDTPLPLFVNMTFFANVINKFTDGAIVGTWEPLAEMISQLEPLVEPRVCTVLTTTYPNFREGIIASPHKAMAAVDSIVKDPSFGRFCKSHITQGSLREMVSQSDGGVGYLFNVVANSLSTAKRSRLLLDRYRHILAEMKAAIDEHAPMDIDAQRRKDIESIKGAIDAVLLNDEGRDTPHDRAGWLSCRIRALFDVPADALDPIPMLGRSGQGYQDYVRRQLANWMSNKSACSSLADLGLPDSALRARFLGYLEQRVDVCKVADWLMKEVPAERSFEDSLELRRLLAIRLSNDFSRPAHKMPPHPDLDGNSGVIATIKQWADAEDSHHDDADIQSSPHFAYVILPAITLLGEVAEHGRSKRNKQGGDHEARCLAERIEKLIKASA